MNNLKTRLAQIEENVQELNMRLEAANKLLDDTAKSADDSERFFIMFLIYKNHCPIPPPLLKIIHIL